MALNTVNSTGNGNLDAHAQFGVDFGVGADEDLPRISMPVGSTV
jgi:hypothetical protein